MSRCPVIIGIVLLALGSFLGGAWVSYRAAGSGPATGSSRKILYYVDPMHPAYHSDKPGIAPDCGMPLEPVYADGTAGAQSANSAKLPPGTVQISSERMQAVGIAVGEVGKAGGDQLLRLSGRVVPDETRTFVINATIDGWITSVGTATTGSLVKKHEILASFYSPEFLSAVQALMFALTTMDRSQAANGGKMTPGQSAQMDNFGLNLKQYRDSLRNLGMGEPQVEDMIKTHKFMDNVHIIAPSQGFVLGRFVAPGLRFDKGKELFRIADLSKIWILADTFGPESSLLKPGMAVKVSLPNGGKQIMARVSAVPPQFDSTSRTLRVRLEADNPGYALRPDMFVDVEVPVHQAAAISIPTEALLDSGLKKMVFVEKSIGVFEPREVETGHSFGGRVEITSGLKAGERIAISGTFLLDSESRMKTSAAGISSTPQLDPVCGMYVDEARARAAGLTVESGGKTHFFCSPEDKNLFLKNPAAKRSMINPAMPAAKPAAKKQGEHQEHKAGGSSPEKSDEHSGHQMPMGAKEQ